MIWKGLFGFRKGLFIYTPLILFAFTGFFFLKKKAKEWTFAIPVVSVVAIYIILSWWSWWYGGGFGLRPFVDYYGLLSLPLAAFIASIPEFKRPVKFTASILLSISIFLGIYNYIKYYYGTIHFDSMTWKAYKNYFFKIHDDKDFKSFLEHPDYQKAKLERE